MSNEPNIRMFKVLYETKSAIFENLQRMSEIPEKKKGQKLGLSSKRNCDESRLTSIPEKEIWNQ